MTFVSERINKEWHVNLTEEQIQQLLQDDGNTDDEDDDNVAGQNQPQGRGTDNNNYNNDYDKLKTRLLNTDIR